MNGKLEEELLQAAFGDLSDEEIARIERELETDPQAAKTYASYREMRNGLVALRDVPDHQLSTERLRNAILGQGLRPGRPSWQLGWLIPTAALAVGLFGYFALDMQKADVGNVASNGISSGPPVASTDLKTHDARDGIEIIVREFNPDFDVADPEGNGKSISVDVLDPRSRLKGGSSRGTWNRLGGVGIRVSAEPYGPEPEDKALAPTPGSGGFGPGGGDAMSAGSREKAESGIVVIESERDGMTGANRATEVDSPKNVVIGG